jgi:tRNA pseudouridine55 synthase
MDVRLARCSGIILVDKPVGPTSFGVVARVRRSLRLAFEAEAPPGGAGHHDRPARRGRRRQEGRRRLKCGHAGSLDPLATGLLLLLVGAGTRLAPFLIGLPKSYLTVLYFGVGTDSHDADGTIDQRLPVRCDLRELDRALADFRGEIEQVPPAFSAVRHGGRRLYQLARRGEPLPDLAPKRLRIDRLEIEDARWGVEPAAEEEAQAAAPDGLIYAATLSVACSSGTYVRALVRDLAARLKTAGHVRALRRESVGPFRVDEALPPAALGDGAALAAAIRPLAAALPHLPALAVGPREAGSLRQGGQPELAWLRGLDGQPEEQGPLQGCFRILDGCGDLVAVGRIPAEGGLPRTAAVFTPSDAAPAIGPSADSPGADSPGADSIRADSPAGGGAQDAGDAPCD